MNLKEINEALSSYVKPQTFPAAIRMCETEKQLPAETRRPKKTMGITVAACQAITMAHNYGWTAAVAQEDQSCPYSEFILGFVPGKGYLDGSYAQAVGGNKENFTKTAQATSRLEYNKYHYLLAAPLSTAAFEPQIIMVFGTPAPAGRLVRAATVKEEGFLTSVSRGGLVCSTFIARTMNRDECQFILNGGGFYNIALTQDHERAFTMPMSKVEDTMQSLEQDYKAGRFFYSSPTLYTVEAKTAEPAQKFLKLLREEKF